MKVELSEEQKAIFAILEGTSQHVFVTGRAGTGKSTLLRYFEQNTNKNVVVLAPTGVAAINVEGQTIHSFFKLPIGIIADHDLWQPEELRKILRTLDAVIIDEVSMVNSDQIDAINRSLKQARRSTLPFGGVQLILFGDPYQLSPVAPREVAERAWFDDNYDSLWFFDAKVWQDVELLSYELKEIHRQDDDEFKQLLNAVRHGRVTAEQAAILNNTGARPMPDPLPITLAARNDRVNFINQRQLSSLAGKSLSAVAELNGEFGKNFPAEYELELKVGARVMFLRNDPDKRWVNGTIGTVSKITESVFVEIDDKVHKVEPSVWEKIQYSYDPEDKVLKRSVVGEFTQFPLRLAWAVTIHKSQGMTYSEAVIDLGSGAFSPGQSYVALSRLSTLSGLYLTRPLTPRDVIVDRRVSEFMRKSRSS